MSFKLLKCCTKLETWRCHCLLYLTSVRAWCTLMVINPLGQTWTDKEEDKGGPEEKMQSSTFWGRSSQGTVERRGNDIWRAGCSGWHRIQEECCRVTICKYKKRRWAVREARRQTPPSMQGCWDLGTYDNVADFVRPVAVVLTRSRSTSFLSWICWMLSKQFKTRVKMMHCISMFAIPTIAGGVISTSTRRPSG